MLLKATVLLTTLLFPFVAALCQGQPDCSDLKDGTFYSYPKNTSDRYMTYIADGQETEVDLIKGDTSLWQMDWKGACSYTLKYLSGGKTLAPEALQFIKKHKLYFEIESGTPDYYVYASYIDKRSGVALSKDTMWRHEKVTIPHNEVVERLEASDAPQKAHFSDTSAYAVLYLYRPGKLTNSLSPFFVYLNDNALWVAQNNSGMMFKILKPGKYRISSKLLKDETTKELNVQMGKSYILKTKVNWQAGFNKHLYNFKLEIEEPDAAIGKVEFSETKYR